MKTRKILEFPSQRVVRKILCEVEQIRRQLKLIELPVTRGEIVLDCILQASARPREMLHRGAATLALAETLAKRGACVGIVVYLVSDPELTVPPIARYVLKRPSSPFDIRYLAEEYSEIELVRISLDK